MGLKDSVPAAARKGAGPCPDGHGWNRLRLSTERIPTIDHTHAFYCLPPSNPGSTAAALALARPASVSSPIPTSPLRLTATMRSVSP